MSLFREHDIVAKRVLGSFRWLRHLQEGVVCDEPNHDRKPPFLHSSTAHSDRHRRNPLPGTLRMLPPFADAVDGSRTHRRPRVSWSLRHKKQRPVASRSWTGTELRASYLYGDPPSPPRHRSHDRRPHLLHPRKSPCLIRRFRRRSTFPITAPDFHTGTSSS